MSSGKFQSSVVTRSAALPDQANRSERSMLGRLSGWRLVLFLPLLLINVGALVALNFLPLILNGQNFESALCVLAAINCTFIVVVHSTNISATSKVIAALAHLLACLFAVLNFDSLTKIQPSPNNLALIFAIVFQAILMTAVGFAFAFWRTKKWKARFSLSELMILLFGLTILFPLILFVAKSPITSYFSTATPGTLLLAGKLALLNCAIALLVVSMFEWPALNSRLATIGRFLLLWNLVVVAVSRVIFAPSVLMTMGTVVLIWVTVSMLPFYKMKTEQSSIQG